MSDIVTLSLSHSHSADGVFPTTLALMADGTLRAWGHNKHGAVGDGTTVDRVLPTPITIP